MKTSTPSTLLSSSTIARNTELYAPAYLSHADAAVLLAAGEARIEEGRLVAIDPNPLHNETGTKEITFWANNDEGHFASRS